MNQITRCVCLLFVAVLSQVSLAAKNPIGWSLNREFPSSINTGTVYTVTYTLTNQLPYRLQHPLQILKNSSSSIEFSYIDGCSGQFLASNQSCTVEILLSPLYVGAKFVQISIAGFDQNIVPLPMLTTAAGSSIAAGVVGNVTQALPSNMQVGHTANFQFTYTNYGDTDATNVVLTVTKTAGTVTVTHTDCMNGATPGTIPKDGSSCIVEGTFSSTTQSPSTQTVSSTITFDGPSGSPASVSSTTTVNAASGDIVASLVPPNYLPPLMTPGQQYKIEFLFSNVSGQDITLTNQGTVACVASDSSNCSANISGTVSQCVNGSLQGNPAQSCNLTTYFTAPAASTPPLTYTVTGSLAYVGTGTPASISTSGTVLSSLPTTRTLKMVNHCGFTVWYSLNGAPVSGYSSAACPPETEPASTGDCYWKNQVGMANQLLNGGIDYVTIPAVNYGGVQWSGNISASTGCDGSTSCKQATCDNHGGSTSCAPSKGFSQPATQAEITMLVNSADNYDIEVINGFHIPISMEPYYYISSNGSQMIPSVADNFSCGTPGNYFSGGGTQNGFGSCDWQTVGQTVSLPTPTAYYYWVGGGSGGACPCSGSELCGLNGSFNQVCGNFLGYWNPNELCTQNSLPSSIRSALECDKHTGFNLQPPDTYNNTYTSLMACPVAKHYTGPTYNSCYKSYSSGSAVNQCCGCVNWWDNTKTIGGETILANTTSQPCPSGQVDTLWTTKIQKGIQWMKQACPSFYVYPFDDATSKFTCTNNIPGGTNSASYVITFCPGNNGLPIGANDDRASP